ncbi:cytochrome P450 [Rhizopus microsporus var. microsporus]|uniref:Cytochrome P450 n=2 Tax=Rhizopus microsporus TaxID=58291 RepID=A0A2G4T3U2_RHIZD|nr:cytochrome P450 [Rhizopus microsporus ATCC 52813]ORE06666.1 cytochrome P450 [Rhizopus microsporus var. microsporus]PHZ15678.1 cytochrome P450 [Rhizopus microsporus ATCC 52813]
MSLKDASVGQQLAIAGAAVSSIITLMSLKYHDRPLFYEHIKDIPFIKGYPLVGNLPTLIKNIGRRLDYAVELYEKTGALTITLPVAGLPRQILTIDPRNIEHILKTNFSNYVKGPQFNDVMHDLLGHGIFNANGDQWKWQRKTASHIFNVKNFRDQFTDVFVKELHLMCDHILDKAASDGSIIDFQDIMFRFTLDSFVYLGFGTELNSLLKDGKVEFAESFDFLQRRCAERFSNPTMKYKERFPSLFFRKEHTASYNIKVVDTFAQQVIEKRREEIASGETSHKDLLSRFMEAKNENGEPLNDKELRDTVLNFIIAGRDTTAQALSWLFYNISLQPRIERKMLEEIEKYMTDGLENDSSALYQAINEMSYLHAVFFETLRLHPSVPGNQKYALEDDVWPDGTFVKAGTYVSWNPYAQGRNKNVWGDNAKEFYPERWLDENGSLKRENAGKWPAFHAGPRICLGQNLATLEALICVSMLLRRYSFTLVSNQIITYGISLTHPMKNGMKMFVERRQRT